jgi:hypothetical protein
MVENKFLAVIDEIKKRFPQIVAVYNDDELIGVVHFLWRLGEIEYEVQASTSNS